MTRYEFSNRWIKADTGAHVSPCGNYAAYRESNDRWRLCQLRWVDGVSIADLDGSSTHFTLADCQEMADRYRQSVLP